MKKFYLLLKKEIKEMLSPQLWVPFIAVIVVFMIVGNVANKQMKEQNSGKDSIAIADLDDSKLSIASIETVSNIADVIKVETIDSSDLLQAMKEKGVATGIIFPAGFEQDILQTGKAQLDTYALMNNFSVLAGKKLAIADVSTAAINETISTMLINNKVPSGNADTLKKPIIVKSYVSANDKVREGSSSQILGYVLGQTTTIPVVLFVVIIMASQMIASAVATEKENKTLETLLSLPISRKVIVSSKMIAAGLVSLLMAGVYMLAFRNMNTGISGAMSGIPNSPDASQVAQELGLKISTTGFIEIGVILFLAILLALSIAMILGAFAEDAKSAQGVVAPLMILVLIPYFISLFMDINSLSPIFRYFIYAIPFSHIFLAMQNILLGNHTAIFLGGAYLLILFIVFVLLAAKIFSSDLILTMKLNFSKKKKT